MDYLVETGRCSYFDLVWINVAITLFKLVIVSISLSSTSSIWHFNTLFLTFNGTYVLHNIDVIFWKAALNRPIIILFLIKYLSKTLYFPAHILMYWLGWSFVLPGLILMCFENIWDCQLFYMRWHLTPVCHSLNVQLKFPFIYHEKMKIFLKCSSYL